MEIIFEHSISVEEYTKLREAVGFRKIPEHKAQIGLDHSTYLLAAMCGDRCVGTARLLTDGGYVAYIADVIVLPEFQGRGIGKMMVKNILNYIKRNWQEGEPVLVCLMAAKDRESFYQPFGFSVRPNEENGAGMSQWILP